MAALGDITVFLYYLSLKTKIAINYFFCYLSFNVKDSTIHHSVNLSQFLVLLESKVRSFISAERSLSLSASNALTLLSRAAMQR